MLTISPNDQQLICYIFVLGYHKTKNKIPTTSMSCLPIHMTFSHISYTIHILLMEDLRRAHGRNKFALSYIQRFPTLKLSAKFSSSV